MNTNFSLSRISTPIGEMAAVADDTALHMLTFSDSKNLSTMFNALKAKNGVLVVEQKNTVINQIEHELENYFAGTLHTFKTPLNMSGTLFQQHTWQALMHVPYGNTCSYKQLARAIHKPTAFRAVANANGKNNLVIIIPCHRVVSSNGGLGGYNTGVARKKWLLDHEQQFVKNNYAK